MRLRTIKFFGVVFGLLLGASWSHAQAPSPSEYQLKAAFLYNFAKFVEWPQQSFADDKSEFVIGILGDNPFGEDLANSVKGKKINEHPIRVQKFETADDIKCHILFISSSEKKNFPNIFTKIKGGSILTVGEAEQFIQAGGIINFIHKDNKIRFQINDEAAKSIQLKISSKLLTLAISSAP